MIRLSRERFIFLFNILFLSFPFQAIQKEIQSFLSNTEIIMIYNVAVWFFSYNSRFLL